MQSEVQEHQVYDLWWKNAVVYCLDVETYLDTDGDGIGDFRGLTERIDYLAGLGVTCLWLMPFYPTPNRDDGYDVKDHYGIDHRLGDFGDFTEFMRAARERGIRVIVDLVVNHTSTEHPWFQQARQGPDNPYHDYYVWQDEPPEDWETSLVFPGTQEENWTYDEQAGRYYLHRFYHHQPDLNPDNPRVRHELEQIMSFWIQQQVSGFRVDAVPYLIELDGIGGQLEMTPHGFLKDLAAHLARRRGDAITLGEVNLVPQEQREFFGDGDELDLVFNFFVNQHLHLALVRGDAAPLRNALQTLPSIPSACQWANFVTNHDELNLDKLTEAERQEVFTAFAPDEDMRLYGRGIRRRLPSMLEGDERRLRLVYSVLFSLPGTPVLFYGEEIGMGENLDVPDRRAVRTPMQWSSGLNAGFSTADPAELRRPLPSGRFGPKQVNVVDQLRDPDSMLSWMQRLIRRRRDTPEFGMATATLLDAGPTAVLALRFDWGSRRVVTVHNLGDAEQTIDLSGVVDDRQPVELWSDSDYEGLDPAALVVAPHGYRWIRLAAEHDLSAL